MIADVILDLKSKPVDRPFSYLVPEALINVVEVGERCFVQFSSFRRMGIIVQLRDEKPDMDLKEIDELIDIEPVLTKELIELGKYLSETSCYPLISYLQTMIPSALKVTYRKYVKLVKEDDFRLSLVFNGNEVLDYSKLDKMDLEVIKEGLRNGDVELHYDFDRKESIIYKKIIKLEDVPEKLSDKQKKIVDYLKDNGGEAPWLTLRDDVSVNLDTIKRMIAKGIISMYDKETYRDAPTPLKPLNDKRVTFTDEQDKVYKELYNSLDKNSVYLLHGITGSGKTEIYLNLIEEVIKKGKEAIVLVPEISLTPMMVNRFKSRFGEDVAIFHSELSNNMRYDEWRKVLRKEVKIVVGARSAIFVPFSNLGIIIIDEEHEQSYKQDNSPIYHARNVAEWRAKRHNSMLLLGSATPSIESYARARKGVYNLVELKNRANNLGLPKTIVVDLNEEYKNGLGGTISFTLEREIKKRLDRGEQSLLLLNRRGYSNYIMCRSCGAVRKCPNCDVSLTYHDYDKTLKCHYCNYQEKAPIKCPKCGSSMLDKIGTGTEKVEEELHTLFPGAKVVRMDNDTTRGKQGHEKVLYDFEYNGDILIGTQMIAKGLDFPNVTLVGVLNADQALNIPDYRSKELTFELLTQVSGRAGRGDKPGLVVVQTYNQKHYAIKYGLLQDYLGFYEEEMKFRKLTKFIPFYNMTVIKLKAESVKDAYTEAMKVKTSLDIALKGEDIVIMGPIPPTISRMDSLYIFNVILKYKIVPSLDKVLKRIYDNAQEEGVLISVDRFPTQI